VSISYDIVSELLSAQNDAETTSCRSGFDQYSNDAMHENLSHFLNLGTFSLENCDAQELMHCYQLALDFGIPAAKRALAQYRRGHIRFRKA